MPIRSRHFAGALLGAGGSFVLILAAACPARAFERELRVGGGAGVATLSGFDLGPSADLHVAYGLSDMFDLNLELGGSRHTGPSDPLWFGFAGAGATYKIDVFEWVPYVGGMAGYYVMPGAKNSRWDSQELGFALMYGLDYLPSREFSIGVHVKNHGFVSGGFSMPAHHFVLRGEYRWGW